MKENVGRVDQIGRFLAGPALMALGYGKFGGSEGDIGGLAAMISGALVVESAITRTCPINGLIGLDTRSESEVEEDLRKTVISSVGQIESEDPARARQGV